MNADPTEPDDASLTDAFALWLLAEAAAFFMALADRCEAAALYIGVGLMAARGGVA